MITPISSVKPPFYTDGHKQSISCELGIDNRRICFSALSGVQPFIILSVDRL